MQGLCNVKFSFSAFARVNLRKVTIKVALADVFVQVDVAEFVQRTPFDLEVVW